MRAQLREWEPTARHGVLAFEDARVDACLSGGGLALGQLHEIAAEGIEAETGAVAAGFAACLLARIGGARPVFWISPVCDLHAPGLLAYGLDPGRLIMVRSRDDAESLAAMEAALREGAAGAVLGEVGKLARTPSRRLQLACLKRGTTGFVLRRWPWGRHAQDREATAAVTRWRIAPAPSAAAFREPGPPRWEVELTHSRGGLEGAWIMEISEGATHATHPLRVVAELADAAPAPARFSHAS